MRLKMKIERYSGIDEAGLGPILGPFCATAVTFKAPGDLKQLTNDLQKKLFYVDDSKKVFQGKNGFKRLELNVLAFYYILGNSLPKSINSFIPSLNSSWNCSDIPLPIETNIEQIKDAAALIKKVFNAREIELLDIKRTAVSPINFNKLIDMWDNKSIVCQKIIQPLLTNCFNNEFNQQIVVDKQGGRKFYKEYLDSILNIQSTAIVQEENNHSIYRVNNNEIHFMAKADSNNFTVALASMFSKYMRELGMLSFNNYWKEKSQDLKRTAGYYTDGIRFITELEKQGLMPENIDSIIRKK